MAAVGLGKLTVWQVAVRTKSPRNTKAKKHKLVIYTRNKINCLYLALLDKKPLSLKSLSSFTVDAKTEVLDETTESELDVTVIPHYVVT